MSKQRLECLRSMRENFGVPVELVTWRDLDRYILPEAPLHEGFKYLSCIHRSDYLRCYFAHFHGGGYADIKPYTKENNWGLCFDAMDALDSIQVVGQPEFIDGTPVMEFNTPFGVVDLISVSYFITRPWSAFTTAWYERLLERMDGFLPALRAHQATDPFGGDGYPVPWVALLGDIFPRVVMDLRRSSPNAVFSALASGIDRTKGWR